MSGPGWIHAFAPATVANVACGFDLCGFALESPGDEVHARRVLAPGAHLVEIRGADLPQDADRNTATVAVNALLRATGAKHGVELRLHKGIAPSSGIGSSAASAVAAVVATAELLEDTPDFATLLRACTEGERAASGFPHADNVTPSLVGGFVLVRRGPTVTTLRAPDDLACALIHPHIEVDTRKARAVLPREVPLADAVEQAGNLAALTAGLLTADYELIATAMHDRIAEPRRAALTPGFDAVKRDALAAGALGCSLSGSGPSIFALCRGRDTAEQLAQRMAVTMVDAAGVSSDVVVSGLNAPGARLMD